MMTIATKYIITPCLQLGQRQYTHLDAVLVVFSFSWMNAAISSRHDFNYSSENLESSMFIFYKGSLQTPAHYNKYGTTTSNNKCWHYNVMH